MRVHVSRAERSLKIEKELVVMTGNRIKRKEYLRFARNFKPEEVQLIQEFEEWLPKKIVDCHAHCCLPEHITEINDEIFHLPLSSFPGFNIEESKEWKKIMYPGKEIISLRFSLPFPGIDYKEVNNYLLSNVSQLDKVAIFGSPDDVEYTIKMLMSSNTSAFKSYPLFSKNNLASIYDYFPKEVLYVAEEKEIPIILHLPKKITDCCDQVSKIANDFPCLKICIAHLGLEKKISQGLIKVFSKIEKYENIFCDTSLISSSEVIGAAIDVFGAERIMYGSDEPLNLLRFVIYEHPVLGDRLVTDYLYHWVNLKEHLQFKHLAFNAVHSHWSSLLGIRKAVEKTPLDEREGIKQKIFYNNAKNFFCL